MYKSNTSEYRLELILKEAPRCSNRTPLPYEMLMKIFRYVIDQSDYPVKELSNLARVCEAWREIILGSPSLWNRIDLTGLPLTDGNIRSLKKIFDFSPGLINHVDEVALDGSLSCKDSNNVAFIEILLTAPNLTKLLLKDLQSHSRASLPTLVSKCVARGNKLRSLSITQSKNIFNHQKWLADYLVTNGRHLEVLNLSFSLNSISSHLFRSFGNDFCPNLKVLDVSTCDTINTHSFDAIQLVQNMPDLEILRCGNVSFKRVYEPPTTYGLTKLKELSIPIGIRDADRDDALFATLAYGSRNITTLDLRGASITAHALLNLPSLDVRELHIDDLNPITRGSYHLVIQKWSHSLEVLSLVKINCSKTLEECLNELTSKLVIPKLRDLDLSSSAILAPDLDKFIKKCKTLKSINLSSCRSLPRGCKGQYSRQPTDSTTQKLHLLLKKLR